MSQNDDIKLEINVRDNIRNYIMDKVIESCKKNKNFEFEVKLFILVVDEYTKKLLTEFIGLPDLLDKGILGLEQVEFLRKPFPHIHALYFLRPTKENIDFVARDFPNEQDRVYGYAHLVFNNFVKEDILEKIKETACLHKFIVNLKYVYLDFAVEDNSLITLRRPKLLKSLYSSNSDVNKAELLDELSEQVSTMVSAISNWEKVKIVYTESSDDPAAIIAKKVKVSLERMKAEGPTRGALEPSPLVLIIMDRTMDPVTPLLHDLYYYPVLFDLLEIKNNLYEYETNDAAGKLNIKIMKFNETNALWVRFRSTPFMIALKTIITEFNDFVANNSASKVQRGETGDMSVEELAAIVRDMPAYQQKIADYTFHVHLLEKSVAFFKARDLVTACELEQSIVTGSDEKGKPYKFKDFSVFDKFKVDTDRIRFICTLAMSYNLDAAEMAKLKKLCKPHEKKYLDALNLLNLKLGSYRLNLQDIQKVEGNPYAQQDRSTPKVREVVEQLRFGNLPNGFTECTINNEEFPKVAVQKGDALKAKFRQADDEVKKPIFLVFVPGGIATNEIRELRDIETDPEIGGIITIGAGTDYLTPQNYLKELKIINQDDSDDEKEATKIKLAEEKKAGEEKKAADEKKGGEEEKLIEEKKK